MDVEELRLRAKALGIKSWHVKAKDNLITEIAEKESAIAESAFNETAIIPVEIAESLPRFGGTAKDDDDATVKATYYNGYQAWLPASEADKLTKDGIVISYEKA